MTRPRSPGRPTGESQLQRERLLDAATDAFARIGIHAASLRGIHHVKSAVIHPTTGRLAYTEAETPEWWTSRIRFRHPDGEVHLPGERLYKIRWVR